jgi:hypothetical protein
MYELYVRQTLTSHNQSLVNMTKSIHVTANFMHWHRYFVWAFESALRSECGYKGYQPYWNCTCLQRP